ncbi:MAG TPA: ABC transporter ATP-binding protein [Terriglobales bacterium]|nr:ABC transporter ATP-binding protein [Terriglobales bacterium]
MPYFLSPRRRRLARLFQSQKYFALAAVIVGIGIAALGAVEPLFYRTLTDLLVAAAGATNGAAYWRWGVAVLSGLALLLLAQRALQTLQAGAVNRVRFDASFELSHRVLGALYVRPLSFHQQSAAGYLLTRLDRGIAALGQLTSDLLQSLLPNAVNLALMTALLFELSPRLAWLALAPMPVFLWATARGARESVRHETVVQEGWSRLYSRVTEVLSAIKTVKSVAAEAAEVTAYRLQARAIFKRLWRLVWVGETYGHVQNLSAIAGRTAVGIAGFALVLERHITPGTWIAATTYATMLYGPLAGLAATCTSVARQSVAAAVTLDFLDDSQVSPPAASPPSISVAAMGRLRGDIRFERVSYIYPAGDAAPARYALEDVTFSVAAGETVAVVGPSGGGKTTLMDLLLGFHAPTGGRILLDGRDLGDFCPSALRAQIGVVLQEPLLLEGTIAENVAYGCTRRFTEADLEAAIIAAQAGEFVNRLPEGMQTRLRERGAGLSGGEKQRLAIARALLRDPRILILDEATAHLDPASEAALNRALRRLVEGRTALVISHRLASLLATDRILVMDGGRLVEHGAPAVLDATGGYYARWGARHAASAMTGIVI